MYKAKKIMRPIPRRLILFAIPIVSAIGAFLLSLPVCQAVPLPFLDALFTSISATCVNGLLTIPLDSFTDVGQLVIFFMMQIGGLGIITITLMITAAFVRTGLSTQVIASQILEIERLRDIKKILSTIIIFTLLVEAIGSVMIFISIKDLFPFSQAVFYAIFHSVSAFCNAGFSIFPGGIETLNQNVPLISILGILILAGSLGFITWHEMLKSYFDKKHKMSLHSKLAISSITILIVTFSFLFWILEYNNAFIGQSWLESVGSAIFNSTAIRGSGLLSVSIGALQPATILLIMISSFIGAAPGSTGGGVKTSAFIIFLATIRAAINGKTSVEIKKRRIPKHQVLRALTILTVSLAWIALTTFCLLITEKDQSFLNLLFEANSAFSMFGLSLGTTPDLSLSGKIFIMISMIVGRIGSLTLAFALVRPREMQEITYPEERLMLS